VTRQRTLAYGSYLFGKAENSYQICVDGKIICNIFHNSICTFFSVESNRPFAAKGHMVQKQPHWSAKECKQP